MTVKEKVDIVKNKVSIADYFNETIIPNMSWYYSDGHIADLNIREVIKCPFHNEDTPSLRYYEETNSFYCWGCTKGGDIIKLHREYMSSQGEEVGFTESVDFLYDVFVRGNISKGQQIRKRKKDLLVENKGSDVLIFKMETARIEERMLRDETMSKEDKYKMYRLMDDADRLVELSMINAKDVLKEIKDTYKKLKERVI